MQKLICPSCGSHLELPENLEVAHCLYCGTKIMLQEPEPLKVGLHSDIYKELINNGLADENYNEVIQYCIRALEIDPKDVDLWISIAIATFWVTPENPGYDKAIGYLNKASILSPNDKRINEVKHVLTNKQVEFLHNEGFGNLYWGAESYWSSIRSVHYTELEAQKYSEPEYKLSMDFYMKALDLSPGNPKVIRDIKRLILEAYWIEWSDSDLLKAGLKDEIDTIKEISKKIHELRIEQEKINLNQGYFGRSKRSLRSLDLGVEIRELESKVFRR